MLNPKSPKYIGVSIINCKVGCHIGNWWTSFINLIANKLRLSKEKVKSPLFNFTIKRIVYELPTVARLERSPCISVMNWHKDIWTHREWVTFCRLMQIPCSWQISACCCEIRPLLPITCCSSWPTGSSASSEIWKLFFLNSVWKL